MTQTPNENEEVIEETPQDNPPTPEGAGGEETPETPPTGIVLKPEEEGDFRQFQEIKKTTGFTKFSESAKEAQRLSKINKEQEDALTEKELIAINPNYETMTEEEKAEEKKKQANEKRILSLEAKEKFREDYRKLPPDIKKLIEEKGGEEVFRDFACDPSRAGADLLTVSQSFVFDIVKSTVIEKEKKPGLEIKGGGGQPSKPITEGYTAEQAANLRKTNPALYTKLVQQKRLKIIEG